MHTAAMRLVLLGLGLSLLLASCSKHSGGQTGDEDALPSGDEFFGELGKRGGFGNYPTAASVADMLGRSERVVVGRAIALRAGRSLVEQPSGDVAMRTAVLELEVERTLKGPAGASLYLEFIVGAAEAGAPDRLPDARVVAFAVPTELMTWGDYTVEGEGRGLPRGQTLYRLTTPQGFAVAGEDGGFSQPFERDDSALGDGDLDDLIDRIEAALELPASDGGTAGSGGSAGGAGSGGSAAGSSAPAPDAGACPGELPFNPGATLPGPACPSGCEELRGSPFDETNTCVDYANQILIGCTEGVGPPVVVCVERPEDGMRFQVGAGWPFPMSTTYRTCSDDDASAVLSAPACG